MLEFDGGCKREDVRVWCELETGSCGCTAEDMGRDGVVDVDEDVLGSGLERFAHW